MPNIEEAIQKVKTDDEKTRAFDTAGYEDKQGHVRTGDLGLAPLETVEYMWPGRDMVSTHETTELTAVCPRTGLPDFYNIKINYIPDKRIVELKALKLHLTSYRQVGIFTEHLANRILDDFVKATDPKKAQIVLIANPRGGVGTECIVEYNKPSPVSKRPEKRL